MTIICTGKATLKKDEEGKKYWYNYDDGDHDGVDMDIGECLGFNPETFEEGTEIRIMEHV